MVNKSCCLIILLCGALVLAGCAKGEDPGPEAALAQYIRLWQQGNWSGMYQLLTAESQAEWDEETFCRRHANISEGIGLVGLSLRQVARAGQVLEYTLEFETTTVGNFSLDYSLEVAESPQGWKLNWDHCHIFPQLTAQRVVRVSRQLPQRGSILDRDNVPLATTGSAYSVGLVPGSMDEHSPGRLALLLDRQEEEIRSLLEQAWVREDTFVPVQTLSQQDWFQLRPALTAIKGVLVREREARVYNIPDSLAQTVGYVGEIPAERLKELEKLGFRAGDIVGQAGLELAYDHVLAGRPGFTITIREGQEVVATLAQQEPMPGQDVKTTLDLAKIRLLDSVLGDWTGSMLLMDFTSGAILGAVSKPGFDSNLFALGITPEQYQELKALDTPFYNRPFNGIYPPGSVFKPFTALMALEQGVVDPEYAWDTPVCWQKSPSWGGYQVTRVERLPGPVNLWEAMKWSDNVYFADLGLKVGWQAFEEYASALGFGAEIPLSLNYHKSQVRDKGQGEVLLADTSYGQGEMVTTPLHMTLMYTAIARRDGTIPVPRLVETEPNEIWLDTGFDPAHLDLLDGVLAYAASDHEARAWVGQETVRGKTGTSEISQDRQIAWYICYFDNLILTVCLEGDRNISSLHAVNLARHCLEQGIRDR